VIGLCEAACYTAMMLGNKFSIVTTLERSIPAIEQLTHHYGAAQRCASIRASDIPVLSLESADEATEQQLSDEIKAAITTDGAEVIVLGCAGMADMAKTLTTQFSIPVVDGVSAAVKMAEALVSMELTTSKALGYQSPRAKNYQGMFARFQP